jgi:hypothetical protein
MRKLGIAQTELDLLHCNVLSGRVRAAPGVLAGERHALLANDLGMSRP